jgi:hypothetical protein
MFNHWSDKYVGIDYREMNCAELVEVVGKEVFNKKIVFPKNNGKAKDQSNLLKKEFYNFFQEEKIHNPTDGCCVLMSGNQEMHHIGLACFINNEWYVLHSFKLCRSVVRQKIKDIDRGGLSIEGYYLWQK